MYQGFEASSENAVLRVRNKKLITINKLTYLASILSSDCSMDAEINSRINKASASFSRIRKAILFSHNLRLLTNVAVFKAVCLSVLLYGCETLTLYRKHVKLLEFFHICCIKAILSLTRRNRLSHTEMLTRCGLQSIESYY